jgi:Ras-related protein Rab-7A
VHAEEFPMIVLGNKCDVEKERFAITEAKAKETCDKHGIPHMLVSAKTGFNVTQAFLHVVKAALKRPHAAQSIPDSLVFLEPTASDKKPEDKCPC